MRASSSSVVVVEGRGKQTVGGNERPGKVSSRTLICCAMIASYRCSRDWLSGFGLDAVFRTAEPALCIGFAEDVLDRAMFVNPLEPSKL